MERCKSTFCITNPEGVRGREFTPPENAEGLAKIWCPDCVKIGKQLTFYASQTAQMIRNIYASYDNTELPKDAMLLVTQFAREIVKELGEEL
jgi:hypothetical protein